jgi:2-polyprenyl-3-methyl-5-hydroxy-6-metoxy-1,4-benzoquinol methylase
MAYLPGRFQCPACKGTVSADTGCCLTCGRVYATQDGILDFVGGRFDTQLDPEIYDASHTISDRTSEIEYREHRQLAAQRWPASLGSVVEIGCGTGMFSRAMIRCGDANDAVLTDVSPAMLRFCRGHLTRLRLADTIPVLFATYSANEVCFADAAFDTCVGMSVVHHIADVRVFLRDVQRFLKPDGRAFFVEPALRYHRALAMTLADIIAMILAREKAYSPGRQAVHNWIAEARRGIMLQGDFALLARYEDKHMFDGDAFEAMALEAGFATAEALPSTPDPDGLASVGGLLARLQVEEPVAGQVMSLWPSYANRYLRFLNAKDLSMGYLFWLTKSDQRSIAAPARAERAETRQATEAEITGGGMPLRWVLALATQTTLEGLQIKAEGWCVANADIKSVRVAIDGVAHETPVWLPRPDVHMAINANGAYAAWNSLCCGVDGQLIYDVARTAGQESALTVDLVFDDDRFVRIVPEVKLRMGEPFVTTR